MSTDFKKLLEEGIKLLKVKPVAEAVDPAMMTGQPVQQQNPVPAPPVQPTPPAPAQNPNVAVQVPVSVDVIIDKLNSIRGGKSFKDAEVYGQLTSMFKGLGDQDKAILDKLLSQIQQISQSTLVQPTAAPSQQPMPQAPTPVAQPVAPPSPVPSQVPPVG